MHDKTSQTSLPLEGCGPHLIHQLLGPPHLPPQTAVRSLHTLLHNCTTAHPTPTPKFPLTARRSPTLIYLPYPSSHTKRHPDPITHFSTINRTHTRTHTHTHTHTHRETDGIGDITSRPTNTRLYALLIKIEKMPNWPALTIFNPFAMTLRPPDCPTTPSACWRNFGQVVSSRKVIGGGGGLPYRRRDVSLST